MATPNVSNGRPKSCKLTLTGASTSYLHYSLRMVDSVRVQASVAGDVGVYPSDSTTAPPALPTGAAGPLVETAMTDMETRYLDANATPQVFAFSGKYAYVHFRVPATVTLTVNGLVMGE